MCNASHPSSLSTIFWPWTLTSVSESTCHLYVLPQSLPPWLYPVLTALYCFNKGQENKHANAENSAEVTSQEAWTLPTSCHASPIPPCSEFLHQWTWLPAQFQLPCFMHAVWNDLVGLIPFRDAHSPSLLLSIVIFFLLSCSSSSLLPFLHLFSYIGVITFI